MGAERTAGGAEPEAVSRAQVLAFRWRAQQLDRSPGAADADLLDFGVQDTGPGGAAWALAVRGASWTDDLVLAWTIRGGPHAYRRGDLSKVAVATSPLSEADARKRIYDASKPLQGRGISALDALATVARAERGVVTAPTVKGELSTRLTGLLDESYLRECGPCKAVHCWEMPFRLAALQGGLVLDPGTSPPVLRRVPGFTPRPYAHLGGEADPRFDVVRNYLRFYGPARPRDVAAFLDAPVRDVTAHWPDDAVPVVTPDLTGRGRSEPRFVLADDHAALTGAAPTRAGGTVRLLGPYDAYLQLKDRDTLVSDGARAKELWRVLGRPGAVVVDGEIVGTWRPRASGRKFTLLVDPWTSWDARTDAAVAGEAERLAEFRDQTLAGITRP
ncbi:MAG: crosslink repair DNA glycosylase YcaQ family protein [Actinocatenispora sp.]